MVRLFVGGLPPVTEEELRARFLPFGEVTHCFIAPPKIYGPDNVFSRNFGHVELEPKDEAALRKCISAYNGCRWKGAVLKCALAHQHYTDRLQAERAGSSSGAGTGASPDAQVGVAAGFAALASCIYAVSNKF